jgi:hypothetical protein
MRTATSGPAPGLTHDSVLAADTALQPMEQKQPVALRPAAPAQSVYITSVEPKASAVGGACGMLACLQVESPLSHASLGVRKLARGLAVFLLAYSTAYLETLTIAHVSQQLTGLWLLGCTRLGGHCGTWCL